MYEREFSEDKFFKETGVEIVDFEKSLRAHDLLKTDEYIKIRDKHQQILKE